MSTGFPSYVIIGAGVFGVSTALHLIKSRPNSSVTLIDRDGFDADSRVAASWDWNKVVRADYDDIVYCRMAIEAQDIFKSDPLWKPYFHESGMYWICRDNYAQDVINNYKKLGRKADLKAIPVKAASKLYGGVFDHADYSGVKEVLVNKTSGWAAAGDCLQAVTREAMRLGVRYVTAEISSLQFNEKRQCTGARTKDGTVFSGTHVILSTGAYTAKLLEICAKESGLTELRAGNRIVAGGITTGMTKLSDEDNMKFAGMPVGVQGYTAEIGPFIGSLPPSKDREMKWWGQTIFSNTQEVVPGSYVSAPPAEHEYDQWNISPRLQKDIDHANQVFYGKKGSNWKMEKYRICWDAFTTSGDFIISPHAGAEGLYIATCGNFHGWKFFPVIGKYVLQMLDNTLHSELAHKWAWNRERPDPKLFADFPRVEMKDLMGGARVSKL